MSSALGRSVGHSHAREKKSWYNITSPTPKSWVWSVSARGRQVSIGGGPSEKIWKYWNSNSGFPPGKIKKKKILISMLHFPRFWLLWSGVGPWNNNANVQWVWEPLLYKELHANVLHSVVCPREFLQSNDRTKALVPQRLHPNKLHLVVLTEAVSWTRCTLVPTSTELSNMYMHGERQDNHFLATSILRKSSSNRRKSQIATKAKQKTLLCSFECNTWRPWTKFYIKM